MTLSIYDKGLLAEMQKYIQNSDSLGYTPLNIRVSDKRLSVPDLNKLLLGIGNHVCPSQKEGFGHYINQARASSALLITTGMTRGYGRKWPSMVGFGIVLSILEPQHAVPLSATDSVRFCEVRHSDTVLVSPSCH